MFERSVALSQFSAGSSIDVIEKRIQQLESTIQAVNGQKTASPVSAPTPAFKAFLGQKTPPPKVQPLTGTAKERFETVQPMVQQYAAQYGVDAQLINAVIQQESGFNPNAVSSAGAQGLMQLMPSTAKGLGVKNAFDPAENLQGGIRHLSGLMEKYHGNVALALAAYNAGGGTVDKFNGIPPYKETQQYVRKILAAYLKQKNSA